MSEQLTEDQIHLIAEQGMAAKQLKENMVFQYYLNGVSAQHQIDLFQSAPHKQKEREMYYHFVIALQGLGEAIEADIQALEQLEVQSEHNEEVI